MYYSIFATLIMLVTSSCATQPAAPITYNHSNVNKQYVDASSRYKDNILVIADNDDQPVVMPPLQSSTGEISELSVSSFKSSTDNDMLILPNPKDHKTKMIYHEVQAGETLESIAEDYYQSPEEIRLLNNLSMSCQLDEAQIIKIKVSPETLNNKNQTSAVSPILKKHPGAPQTDIPSFIKPVNGKIIVRFGEVTASGKSNGITIAAKLGSKIEAIASGLVAYAGQDTKFGNLIIVKLDYHNVYVAYAHLQDIIPKRGARILQGQILGRVGKTGRINSPGLYLAIKEGVTAVNPLKYIKM